MPGRPCPPPDPLLHVPAGSDKRDRRCQQSANHDQEHRSLDERAHGLRPRRRPIATSTQSSHSEVQQLPSIGQSAALYSNNGAIQHMVAVDI